MTLRALKHTAALALAIVAAAALFLPLTHVYAQVACTISVTPNTINSGQSSTLSWCFPNFSGGCGAVGGTAGSLYINGVYSQDVGWTGSMSVSPTSNATYLIQPAPGMDAYTSCSTTLTVNQCAAADSVSGGLAYRLLGAQLNRLFSRVGITACVSNNSNSNYFIPANTAAELQSFLSAISRLPGIARIY